MNLSISIFYILKETKKSHLLSQMRFPLQIYFTDSCFSFLSKIKIINHSPAVCCMINIYTYFHISFLHLILSMVSFFQSCHPSNSTIPETYFFPSAITYKYISASAPTSSLCIYTDALYVLFLLSFFFEIVCSSLK